MSPDSQREGRRRPRASKRGGSRRAAERSENVFRRASTARAVVLVAFGALLQAVVVPYLSFGLVAPALAVLCVVVATAGLKGSVALPVGFFGGTLVDALGSGIFGVGALSGVLAAALSSRAGVIEGTGANRLLLAGVVAAAAAAHDLVSVAALGLSGDSWPPVAGFVSLGILPDAILNGALAYLVGGLLLRLVLVKEKAWT